MASLTNGHEFEQALGVDDGQGRLVCCSPWSHKELDMLVIEQQSLFSLFIFATKILYGIESFSNFNEINYYA